MVYKCLKNDLSSLTLSLSLSFPTHFPSSFSIQPVGVIVTVVIMMLQRLYLEEKNISLW